MEGYRSVRRYSLGEAGGKNVPDRRVHRNAEERAQCDSEATGKWHMGVTRARAH